MTKPSNRDSRSMSLSTGTTTDPRRSRYGRDQNRSQGQHLSAIRKLTALAVLAMLILISASSAEVTELDKYLDCLTDKKVDIVFVFDTSGSMGGEINELSAIAKNFAEDLVASRIDYRLGLVEFRDFPRTSDWSCKSSCGEPDDFPYKVKGEGNLTGDVATFGSWLKSLNAKGGGDGPEATLAALRHAMSDSHWRDDAEKVIIILTDAPPHPDGDCCNAEGDTLDGTIFGLTEEAARVHVIGPDDPALKKIAGDTGGQFYKIRSGLSLKPLLKEISGAMSCSFRVDVEASCENKVLKAKVQLAGKEAIPYVAGQTEAWMYLDQVGNRPRYNLSYDQDAGAYLGEVLDVCGPVDLTVYGRVGERSAVQTVQVDCGTCGAVAGAMQGALSISGRIFDDSNGDGVKGTDEAGLEGWDVLLKGPDGYSYTAKTDRKGYYIFTGLLPGNYSVTATAQENWTATAPETGVQVELVDLHESEMDFGFRFKQAENQTSEMMKPFNKTFGMSGSNDDFTSVQPTPDGGYILAGSTELKYRFKDDFFNTDAWLLKVDGNGNELWNKTFGGEGTSSANSIQITTDGGYILAGLSDDNGGWLIKTDSEGNQIWNKSFGVNSWFDSVLPTQDDGYILAGGIESKAWLVKTDSEGNQIWEKTLDGTYVNNFGNLFGAKENERIQPTLDGGYILAGMSGSYEALLIKTDSEGNQIWRKTFGSYPYSSVSSVLVTKDVGYILAGQLAEAAWLIKMDVNGNELWNKTFSRWNDDEFRSVQPTVDGGYILAGYTSPLHIPPDFEFVDAWLLKVDGNGNELWNKTFAGTQLDWFNSIKPTFDNGYIIAGQTASFGFSGDGDAWLLKVDSEGNIVQLPKKAG